MSALNDEGLKLMTWNVNSLGPRESQIRFLTYIQKSPANISVLIDTWLSKTLEAGLKSMWGKTCYFNSLCGNARGIAVLIKDGVELENLEWQNIIQGNLWKFTFTFKHNKYAIECLYASNKDSSQNNESETFFWAVFDDAQDSNIQHTINVGDYNVDPVHNMDTGGCLYINNPVSRQYIRSRMMTIKLTDIWRDRHPTTRNFTFDKL